MPKTTSERGADKKPSGSRPRVAHKTGRIVVEKATASAIRESLGVTRSEAKAGASAIRIVRASALAKGSAPKTVKQKKRTPSRPMSTR